MWKAAAGTNVKVASGASGDDDWETDPDFVVYIFLFYIYVIRYIFLIYVMFTVFSRLSYATEYLKLNIDKYCLESWKS